MNSARPPDRPTASLNSPHYFEAVGECIYCGDSESKLTDEHIVPRALNGALVLRSASCPRCATVTSRFERKVLRGFMLEARTAGHFATRRPEQRPSYIAVRLLDADENVTVEHVKVSEAPGFLVLPTFDRAGAVVGRPPTPGINVIGMELLGFGSDPEEFARQRGAVGLQAQAVPEIEAFCCLLAKISYAFTVAMKGLFPREETPLIELMKNNGENAGHWIGSSDNTSTRRETSEHVVTIGTWDAVPSEYLGRVHLFASAGATPYEVVTRWPSWRDYIRVPREAAVDDGGSPCQEVGQ